MALPINIEKLKFMKNFVLILISLSVIIFEATAHAQNKPQFFIDFRPLADSLGKAYDLPPCLILGVAYQESGGGTSTVAKKLNNHFGIVGDCRYDISKHQSKYRYYPSVLDSYIGFCKLVASKKFYSSMKGSDDVDLWLKKLSAAGYAPSPKWPVAISKIIKNYCD